MIKRQNSLEYHTIGKQDYIVVLPVYNEIESIGMLIDSIKSRNYPLIITDGGSNDGSIEIAEKQKIHILHRPQKGKGFGLNMALEYAHVHGYKYLVYMDCDMTYPVHQIEDLLQFRHQYDMVVGSRNRINMSIKSKTLNFLIKIILNILFSKKLRDPASGFRVLSTKKFINQIQIEGIDVEFDLLGIAHRNNLNIKEVNVEYYTRLGSSKLTLLEILQVLRTIIQARFMHKNLSID